MGDESSHIPALHELRKLAETTPELYGKLASYDAGALTIEQALSLAVVSLARSLEDTRRAFQSYAEHNPPVES